MKRIGMLSGGVASWAAMKRDVETNGLEGLLLLFCDTKEEDEDTYRFLEDAAANIGAPLLKIADGRTIWELFKEEKMIGNSRVDICSRVLKRELADRWLTKNCALGTTVLLGYHIEEVERFHKARARYAENGWTCRAPLCEQPFLSAKEIKDWRREQGLFQQRLYRLNFPHANCGGFCVKAGQAHFKHLLKVLPEVYAKHEAEEEATRQLIGKDVSIMKDRKGWQDKAINHAGVSRTH